MTRVWKHVTRGTTYTEVGRASLQSIEGTYIGEGADVVIYRDDDGKLWAREVSEFEDGRFISVEEPQAMRDELERAAHRIWDSRKEIWPDGWLDWDAAIAIQDARVGTYRHFAAAALAEPWWRPISEAPDKRPEWGARIGRWSMGYWLVQDWPMGCERDDLTPIHRYYFPMPQPPEPETAP